MLLEQGNVVEYGDPTLVSRRYDQLNFARGTDVRRGGDDDGLRRGDGSAEVVDAWFEDEQFLDSDRRAEYLVLGPRGGRAARARRGSDRGFTLGTEHIPQLLSADLRDGVGPSGTFAAGERIELVVELELPLAPAATRFPRGFAARGAADDGRARGFASITLNGGRSTTDLVTLPHAVRGNA